MVKLYFNKDALAREFDFDLPFVSIGKDCEKVLELLEKGEPISIHTQISDSLAKEFIKEKKAAIFVKGKVVWKGSVNEALKKYGSFIDLFREEENLREVNKKYLEDFNKLEYFKIRNIEISNGSKGFIFLGEEVKLKLSFEYELKEKLNKFVVSVYTKPQPWEKRSEVSAVVSCVLKPKERGKVVLRDIILVSGDYLISIEFSRKGEKIVKDICEILVRKV